MEIQSSRPMAKIEAATHARAVAAAQAADRSLQYRTEQERLQERRAQEQQDMQRSQQAVVNTQGQSTGRILNETA
jgi:hypothetical protein